MNITITQVRNAASLQSDNQRMDVEINHPDHSWIPYTVDPMDTDETINNDEVMALIGSNFTSYVAPTQAELNAETATNIRAERDNILVSVVDLLVSNQLRWAELTSDKRNEWTNYRTNLLGVPQQSGFPNSITWPTEPS